MILSYFKGYTFLAIISLFSISYNTVDSDTSNFKTDDIASEAVEKPKGPKFLIEAEQNADSAAQKILEMGRKMALEDSTILPGTCWTYVNAVFKRAGFGKKKHVVYRSRKKGPYVNTNKIKPGDWLYHINHSYHNIDHSGIFIRWIDKKKKIGLTLSYTGQYKKKPGKYKVYDLSEVFFITRPGRKLSRKKKAQVKNSHVELAAATPYAPGIPKANIPNVLPFGYRTF